MKNKLTAGDVPEERKAPLLEALAAVNFDLVSEVEGMGRVFPHCNISRRNMPRFVSSKYGFKLTPRVKLDKYNFPEEGVTFKRQGSVTYVGPDTYLYSTEGSFPDCYILNIKTPWPNGLSKNLPIFLDIPEGSMEIPRIDRDLPLELDQLCLSARVSNCLEIAGITTIEQLTKLHGWNADYRGLRAFGVRSQQEIREKMTTWLSARPI